MNDNDIRITRDQAVIHTKNGGHEISYASPAGDNTDMKRFLRAVFVRAEEDYGWWEMMVEWLDDFELKNGPR